MRRSTGHIVLLCSPLALAAFVTAMLAGCMEMERKKAAPLPPRYPTLPARENVPAFMKGTIYELADVTNKEPYPVSGYGLVVGLANTGDNTGTSLAVRNFIIDEMVRHGFGFQDEGLRNLKPEVMVRDPRTAIVEVYGYLPPGGRAGQRIDVLVRAAEGSQTKSLGRGNLYQLSLYSGGVDSIRPVRRVNTYVTAQGAVFVSPAFADGGAASRPVAAASLRRGSIMNGGLVAADRPLKLRARTPQLSVTRAIERQIDQQFADKAVANTLDEGTVDVFVPHGYNGDWEHFMGVVTHLYVGRTVGLAAVKGRMLAEEATKPGAPLMDISYCWEGLGPEVMPFIQPLYGHASAEVGYAAARAGAFVGDLVAEEALLEMARTEGHAFQLNAVKTLGGLPASSRIDRMMAELLPAKNTLVRIEAYRVLADHGSPLIITHEIRGAFALDRIMCDGGPLVHATRTGVPRIAVFGRQAAVKLPIMLRTMQDKLTISTGSDGRSMVAFDRTGERAGGIQSQMNPDVHELVYRLGGGSDEGFRFGYSELVGLLQSLSDGRHIDGAFVLQDEPALDLALEEAPPIVDPTGRPNVDAPAVEGGETPRISEEKGR